MSADAANGDGKRGGAIRALGARLRARGKSNGMRYNPFGLFEMKVVGIEPDPVEPEKLFNDCVYTHVATGASVRMFERREVSGTTVSDIRTAHTDGIDNTGNFHWPTEEILAHSLLAGALADSSDGSPCILELGAGASLCGLLVRAAHPRARVIITDGNRGVVDVAARNAARIFGTEQPPAGQDQLLTAAEFERRRMMVAQLLWHRADAVLDACPWILDEVDSIVAADCLFFDQYHADLKGLLCRFLRHERPAERPPCVVSLFAPTRGTTMQRFVDMLRDEPDLTVTVTAEYDAHIAAVHARLSEAGDPEYVPDRHFPLHITVSRNAASATHADTETDAVNVPGS